MLELKVDNTITINLDRNIISLGLLTFLIFLFFYYLISSTLKSGNIALKEINDVKQKKVNQSQD